MSWAERLVTLVDNPLIVKDAVSRMRSWRAPLVVTLYLGLLGFFGYMIFLLATVFSPGLRLGSAMIGTTVFVWLAVIQLSLVSLFAPALAAGAISGERERQTFDVLLVSRVTPLGIVWGKLVASVAFMLLLILAALPLFAAVFLFGGIDFGQFVVTQLLTVTTALSIAAVSLFLSALFRRTLPSTVAAYGAAFAWMVGSFVVGTLLNAVLYARGISTGLLVGGDVHPLAFVNPFNAMFVELQSPNGAPMHVGRLLQLLFLLGGRPNTVGPMIEPWQGAVLVELLVVALSVFGAVRLIQGRRALAPPAPPADQLVPIGEPGTASPPLGEAPTLRARAERAGETS